VAQIIGGALEDRYRLDFVELTGVTIEGLGVTSHYLFIGRLPGTPGKAAYPTFCTDPPAHLARWWPAIIRSASMNFAGHLACLSGNETIMNTSSVATRIWTVSACISRTTPCNGMWMSTT